MKNESQKTALVKKLGISPLGLLLFLFLILVPLFVDDQYIIHILISSMIYGTLAMGFDFTVGFINIVNFGYAAFMGMGAYVSALMVSRMGLSPWVGMIFAGFAAALIGLLTGLLTLRLRGIFAAVMAWFLGLTLMAITANLVDLTRGWLGLNVELLFDTVDRVPYYYVVLVLAIITYLVLCYITRSKVGVAFKAIGQNLEAAQSSGVNSTKYKVMNFTVSCAVAGVLGGFYGHFVGILTPDVMHTRNTVQILALAYIGGRGSIWGGLVAAFLIIPLFEYLRPLMALRLVIYGLLMMLVMIFYPGGMSNLYYTVVGQLKEKLGRGEKREALS